MKTKGRRKSSYVEDRRQDVSRYTDHPSMSKLSAKKDSSRIMKQNMEYYERAAKGTPLGAQAGFKSMDDAANRDSTTTKVRNALKKARGK